MCQVGMSQVPLTLDTDTRNRKVVLYLKLMSPILGLELVLGTRSRGNQNVIELFGFKYKSTSFEAHQEP